MGSAAFQRVSDLGVLEYCKSVKTALIVVDIELLCIFETKTCRCSLHDDAKAFEWDIYIYILFFLHVIPKFFNISLSLLALITVCLSI